MGVGEDLLAPEEGVIKSPASYTRTREWGFTGKPSLPHEDTRQVMGMFPHFT